MGRVAFGGYFLLFDLLLLWDLNMLLAVDSGDFKLTPA